MNDRYVGQEPEAVLLAEMVARAERATSELQDAINALAAIAVQTSPVSDRYQWRQHLNDVVTRARTVTGGRF